MALQPYNLHDVYSHFSLNSPPRYATCDRSCSINYALEFVSTRDKRAELLYFLTHQALAKDHPGRGRFGYKLLDPSGSLHVYELWLTETVPTAPWGTQKRVTGAGH